MRADRLLSILMLLQTRGRMTAHDLAEQLEVSERTIYRDLEALGMAGIPVYTERGPGGGCSLLDGYQTKLTGLTETEVRALFLFNAASLLADLGLGKALNDALLKVSAALPAPARLDTEQIQQRFHLDTAWWYHHSSRQDHLQILQEAVWQDRKLCLLYQESAGCWRELLIEPYGLVVKAHDWYLVAAYGQEINVFSVTRICSATLSEEHFVRPEQFHLDEYWAAYCAQLEASPPPYAGLLRLAPDEAQRLPQLLSEWGYQLVEQEEEKKVVSVSSEKTKKGYEYLEPDLVTPQERSPLVLYAQEERQQEKKGIPFSSRARTNQKKEKKALFSGNAPTPKIANSSPSFSATARSGRTRNNSARRNKKNGSGRLLKKGYSGSYKKNAFPLLPLKKKHALSIFSALPIAA